MTDNSNDSYFKTHLLEILIICLNWEEIFQFWPINDQ